MAASAFQPHIGLAHDYQARNLKIINFSSCQLKLATSKSLGFSKNLSLINFFPKAAGTGVFYAKKKSRQIKDKLKFRKYDPQVQQHVLFEEVK
ncbi:Ribosomal protein L33 [Corchorus capsularis]|uniref:50S ribosomal protein L33, chloroplastic n=1 Tax=Corchorus capsularis TaxID=210143 RepID=A0A1R3J290_COCAP|nr:Ribosomal protein L33 [Corchorus capsularis]